MSSRFCRGSQAIVGSTVPSGFLVWRRSTASGAWSAMRINPQEFPAKIACIGPGLLDTSSSPTRHAPAALPPARARGRGVPTSPQRTGRAAQSARHHVRPCIHESHGFVRLTFIRPNGLGRDPIGSDNRHSQTLRPACSVRTGIYIRDNSRLALKLAHRLHLWRGISSCCPISALCAFGAAVTVEHWPGRSPAAAD